VAAGRIGCTVEEYRRHEAAGEKWCALGQHWAEKRTADRCRSCANDDARQRYVPQRGHVSGLKNISYAGPAFERRRLAPTPDGAAVATRAVSVCPAETASCAQNATAVPSGLCIQCGRPFEQIRFPGVEPHRTCSLACADAALGVAV